MLPSFHDDCLVGYEVDCEGRKIILHVKHWDTLETGRRTVIFTGVEGYHFQNDAFGNIILHLEVVPATQFVSDYQAELAESFRMSGALGEWASDPAAAPRVLSERGVQAFVLSSSYGLSGWVLAKDASIEP